MRVRVLLVFVSLLLVTPETLFAQPDPGTIGIFLDPEGTISVDSSPRFQRPDLWEFNLDDLTYTYTVFLLAQDIEGGLSAYEFALAATYSDARFSLEQFTGAASWSHWASSAADEWLGVQTNYEVELEECIPADGMVVLARVEVEIPVYSGYWDFTVHLRPAIRGSDYHLPRPTGYRPCGEVDPWAREELLISAWVAGIGFADPIEESTWSKVKSLYR